MRRWGCGLVLLVLAVAAIAPQPAGAFDLDDVAARAEALAQQPYVDPHGRVPEWLLNVSYDQWRDIRFRPDASLWRKEHLPFEVQFFHPGLYYDRSVTVNTVDADEVHPLPFSTSMFDYGHNDFADAIPADIGFAGFRVHYAINNPTYLDEVIVFLGASYFRALAKDQVYGLSARGIAVDTAVASGEEFPYFKEFWLVRPTETATAMTIYALLDSQSLTGAYRFVVQPGTATLVDVDLRLYLRRTVQKLGIAPLTSMFLHGENTTRTFDDFRPEVHDSDGLLLELAQGEWLWRPLDNPKALAVNAFAMERPQGFGLIQRDRDFDHYQDLETRTELRPSVWVAPRGDWGSGHVELVEIPTITERNDNIVAFWVPEPQPKPGTPFATAYTTSWYSEDPSRSPGGRVVGTRRDHGANGDLERFVIDFDGPPLRTLPAEAPVRGVVSIASGKDTAEFIDQHVVKNPVTGGWRLTFQVKPKGGRAVELRAFLDHDGAALTETWSETLLP